MIYNVLSISAVQQSDPFIHLYTFFFFHIILHHVPSQVIRYNSLCYTAGPCCLSTPNAIVCIYYPLTPSPSHSLPLPLGSHNLFSQSMSSFLFCGKVCLCHILDSRYVMSYGILFILFELFCLKCLI